MTESVKEPDLQTVTAVGKVLVTDDSTALLLGLLGFSATKLWNTALWHAKEAWKGTPKDAEGEELVRQFGVLKRHRREQIYDLSGKRNLVVFPSRAASSASKQARSSQNVMGMSTLV